MLNQPFKKAILITLLSITSGCATVGPQKLLSSHESYNDAVQLTVSREVLKNVVRIRYRDPMQFINVTSINASFGVSAGGNSAISGIGGDSTTGSVGGNIGYSDSPNITYTPMTDAAFYKSLESPIALQEAVSHIYNWGESSAEDIGFVVAAINDMSDRKGHFGDNYRKQVDALVSLLSNGASIRHFREYYPRHDPIDEDKVNGLAYMLAANNDLYFYKAGDGKFNIATKHMGIGLVIPKPYTEQALADMKTLKLAPGERIYALRTPDEMDPHSDNLKANTIWLVPRSVENMAMLAANNVEVPEEHLRSGVAPAQNPAKNSGIKLSGKIKVSATQPTSNYRIKHRGYWFYVDDTDTDSKTLLATLVSAYTSRLGSKSATDSAPQIVLPING